MAAVPLPQQPMMLRRNNPIYLDNGFLFRHVSSLADGSELLYCDKRKTTIGCTAYAHRKNGVIEVKKPHHGHEPDEAQAQAKMARYTMRQQAALSSETPRQIIENAQERFGEGSNWGSRDALTRMIHRARKPSLPRGESKPGPSLLDFTVKEEEPEADESMGALDFSDFGNNNPFLQNDYVTIPSTEFLNTMQEMIRSAVREGHSELTEAMQLNAPNQEKDAADDVNSTLRKMLEKLAEKSSIPALEQRAQLILYNLDRIKYNPDTILEAVLKSLGG